MPLASPAILAVALGVAMAFAFGGGFALSDWRSSGTIEKLKGDKALLAAANGRCASTVENAAKAMKELQNAVAERERQARQSMQQAQPQVEQHQAVITRIKALPKVPLDQQCEAIRREQVAYVQGRREE